jgi:hypothetical protein
MILPRIEQDHLTGVQPVRRAVHPEIRCGAAAMKDDLVLAMDMAHQPAGHPGEQDPARTCLHDDRGTGGIHEVALILRPFGPPDPVGISLKPQYAARKLKFGLKLR